ncbi:LOW QUALITY PROTEIN: gamma-glutamyl peptidase 3-like [Asparagus officinalis]|uniref:LOW QUALITY PROTEIN: gamma-glutamyl peptidase 3-like n=1 Tax=Asparagus officinalis TaxID=4686 RepID=UPI00098E3271|nr:LOW QUALITY PROTEIN: gamma-glutamyl peptidase 3-like [Asparagus officinalis]
MKLEEEKRFALLLAAKDSDYVKKMYGGYFNVFVKAFGDEGELWDLFRVVEGEFPKVEDLNKYDGFVVSGSPHDAYGDDLWVTELCSLLQNLISMDKRVLGVCFGHQVLCRAFGGQVASGCGGWDLGGVRRTSLAVLQSLSAIQDEKDFAEEAKAKMEKEEDDDDRRFWEKVCKGFLKGIETN